MIMSVNKGVIKRRSWLLSEKSASMTASLHPLRGKSLLARVPRSKLTASTINDFPAPVSPVKILSPWLKVRSTSDNSAKLTI